jgi:murein DD-endopeptidase MepM/ murein hydrolase activator NlpD
MPENTQLEFEIKSSVGRWSKGAINQKDDVKTVQNMLRTAAMILSEPRLDPNSIDGSINRDEQKSDTIKAIEAFQGRFMNTPDGVIGVGKTTWRELMTTLEGTDADTEPAADTDPITASSVTPADDAEFFFPFVQLPKVNWTDGIRRFGARRSGGKRAHAGCDLYFPEGTIIHAISSGRVTLGPYAFYQGTFALEIDHGTFLARYGEIQKSAFVKEGDHVEAGQKIARVGNLIGITNSMLHLELYDKSANGPLTVKNNQTARTASGMPFMRRRDLIDPTPKLNRWKNNLPVSDLAAGAPS